MIAKHEAAQRFAEIMIEKLENPCLVQTNGRMAIIAENAFKLADAMQAEAEKRNKAEAEQKRKEVREILNDANTFIEREGQHFDDVADIQKPYTSSEWQPDWSQAPIGYDWFCVGSNDGYGFFSNQAPEFFKDYYFVGADGFVVNNHGYQGNWKDSLRKRPQ